MPEQDHDELFLQLVTDINRSDLRTNQKNAYKALLFDASPQVLELLKQLFDQDPAWVKRIYKNYLTKRKILRKDDHDAWQKVLEREYKSLKKFEV